MKSLTIIGRRWFDRRYGNTYFSAVGLIDGKQEAAIDYEYGYGDHYVQRITEELEKQGKLPFLKRYENGSLNGPISLQCRDNGIEFHYSVSDIARKKDL